jgi:putative restriction endonuclease
LWTFGRIQQGADQFVAFADVEEPLRRLLAEFGPPRKSQHPEYPFWRLQRDRLWTVVGAEDARARESNTDPPVSELRRVGARGGFTPEVFELLRTTPRLVARAARLLLERHFPPSIHEDVAAAVGLDLRGVLAPPATATRDPEFRDAVLRAYEYRCAVCGFDSLLDGRSVGLEAAHVRWFAQGGPSIVGNGLCLCALHHKALDLGLLGISPVRTLLVSARATGGPAVEAQLVAFRGRPLRPQSGAPQLGPAFVEWHTGQVFKAPARVIEQEAG